MSANITSSIRVAIAATATRSTAIPVGFLYTVTASADCTIRQGGIAVDAAIDTANNFFLAKGAIIEICPVDASDQYISTIAAVAGGSVHIARLDRS